MQHILTTIYQTLQDNPALQAMNAGVYQFPAEDRGYPYVQLEMAESAPSFLRYQLLQCALHFYEHRGLQDMEMFSKMRECLGAHRPRRVA